MDGALTGGTPVGSFRPENRPPGNPWSRIYPHKPPAACLASLYSAGFTMLQLQLIFHLGQKAVAEALSSVPRRPRHTISASARWLAGRIPRRADQEEVSRRYLIDRVRKWLREPPASFKCRRRQFRAEPAIIFTPVSAKRECQNRELIIRLSDLGLEEVQELRKLLGRTGEFDALALLDSLILGGADMNTRRLPTNTITPGAKKRPIC